MYDGHIYCREYKGLKDQIADIARFYLFSFAIKDNFFMQTQ